MQQAEAIGTGCQRSTERVDTYTVSKDALWQNEQSSRGESVLKLGHSASWAGHVEAMSNFKVQELVLEHFWQRWRIGYFEGKRRSMARRKRGIHLRP